ncbi:MAG: hypothetical protein OXT09_09115 [Myxococcales bacterium]|nr:hypothetical protein [Myxococcales bacterium]
MEIRLSVLFLVLLGGLAYGLLAQEPTATLEPGTGTSTELMALEDAFAADRGDLDLARRLSAEYLRMGQPGMAIAAVRAAAPELAADPLLSHRLSLAYEASGRLDDALATAHLALTRCERAIGSSRAALTTVPPRFACNPPTLISLEQHTQALVSMVRWGVTDPRTDPRAPVARNLAQRRASIASLAE